MLDLHIAHDPPSGGVPWKELLPLAPHLFWAIVALVALVMIGPTNIRALLPRITKVGILGIEIQLRSDIKRAARAREIPIPRRRMEHLIRRLARSRQLLHCARILWVDDRPLGNVAEMELLRSLCVSIDLAPSSEDARERLSAGVYDLVLSDMMREGPRSGEALIPDVQSSPLKPPIIFYVRAEMPTPEGAYGLTQAPDKLFELILDALEERRR